MFNLKKKPESIDIISVDPLTHSYFSRKDDILTLVKNPQYKKNQLTLSYLPNNLLLDDIIYISKNIPDDDIRDIIEIKIYEMLALDMSAHYIINYVEIEHDVHDLDEENDDKKFHVFVISPNEYNTIFKETLLKYEYLDSVTPIPLLFKSLYSAELIKHHGIHAFIYLQHNDAFITIYQDANFLYTKSFKFSLNQLHEYFCELIGEKIEYHIFCKILQDDGLATKKAEYQKYFLQLFGQLFTHIKKEIMPNAIKLNQIDGIDTIYLGSDLGIIKGLNDFSKTFLAITTSKLSFDYGFKSKESHISEIHKLLHLHEIQAEHQKYICNFTQQERPPSFFKRESGKLITLIIVTIILALAYPLFFIIESYTQSFQHQYLHKKYTKIHTVKMQREQKLQALSKHKKQLQKLLQKEERNLRKKEQTLDKIYTVKSNYAMKAVILTDLTSNLNEFRVQVDAIECENRECTLKLNAKEHINITRLLRYFTKRKEDKYSFDMNGISYDPLLKRYISKLKVTIK